MIFAAQARNLSMRGQVEPWRVGIQVGKTDSCFETRVLMPKLVPDVVGLGALLSPGKSPDLDRASGGRLVP